MHTRWIAVLLVALAAPACRRTRPVDVDVTQAKDIPREVAITQLQQLLPTAYYSGCTLPKERYRQKHIKEFRIDTAGVEILPHDKDDPVFKFSYAQITASRLDRKGKRGDCTVKLFTAEQARENTEHYYFVWDDFEPAAQVLELFEALRQKQ